MKGKYILKNILQGTTDGISIVFVLAAGLTGFLKSAASIAAVCLILSVAGAMTMAVSAYFEGKKYDPSKMPVKSASVIGLSYAAGGLAVTLPYRLFADVYTSLGWSAIATLIALFTVGFLDGHLHGVNGWKTALRVVLICGLAAAAAFGTGRFFI